MLEIVNKILRIFFLKGKVVLIDAMIYLFIYLLYHGDIEYFYPPTLAVTVSGSAQREGPSSLPFHAALPWVCQHGFHSSNRNRCYDCYV